MEAKSLYRVPEYLSPSSLDAWRTNREQFFLKYLATDRIPKIPQTLPMSVGSSFDAYVKTYLSKSLFGAEGFDFETLFTKQVEVQNRDFAMKAGAHCFAAYKDCGALASVLKLCQESPIKPRFEFSEQHTINGVTIMGRPDCHIRSTNNVDCTLDWKVNGYCANSPKSPSRGYILLRPGMKQHKDVQGFYEGNILVNLDNILLSAEPTWAKQTATYAWLVGVPVGSEFICAIDQLCCGHPEIRVAEHRVYIDQLFQVALFQEYKELWDIVHSNHIFRDISLEDSLARCEVLSKQAEIFQSDDPKVQWALRASRS